MKVEGQGRIDSPNRQSNGHAVPVISAAGTSKIEDESTSGRKRADTMERQRKRRHREPLLYCKLVTKYPVQSFLLTLGGHLLMVVISVILFASGFDLLPIDFSSMPLEINDQPWRPRDLAWRSRNKFQGYYDRTPSGGYRSVAYPRANIHLYYDTGSANVFTKEKLTKIQSIENELTSIPGYDSYCQWDVASAACSKPTSVIRFFDGTYASINAIFNDPNFANIPAVIYEASTNVNTKAEFQFFLSTSYISTPSEAYSSITRSMLPIGYPLQGYTDTESYENKIKQFSADTLKPVLNNLRVSCAEFEFLYRSQMLWFDEVFSQAMKDVLCAIGSMLFIFMFILIHTRSLWITGFAILSIITSFLCTNLIYRIVLDYRYIGFFHILTIFIILGIGADDVFVFYDVWRNTSYERYPSLAHRLSDAYRRSMFSMLFTSTTTAVAFFANTISPLLGTRSFGLFSGLVIIANYISIVVYFPTVVIMYHLKFEKFEWPCIRVLKRICGNACTARKDDGSYNDNVVSARNSYVSDRNTSVNGQVMSIKEPTEEPTSTATADTGDKLSAHSTLGRIAKPDYTVHAGVVNNSFVNDSLDTMKDQHKTTQIENGFVEVGYSDTGVNFQEERKRKSWMVHFFRTTYFKFVTQRIIRWVILAVMVAILIFFTIQLSKIEPDNEGLKVLKASHVYRQADERALYSFVESDEDITVTIYIVWGMYANDMSGCHFSTPKCKGQQAWDTTFNPNTAQAQLAVKQFCDTMSAFPQSTADQYRLKTDLVTGQYQIDCYITDMATFLDAETVSTGTDWSLTYDYAKSVSFMDARPAYYNSSTFTSAYEDYLEIPIGYWLSNGYSFNYTSDFYVYDDIIGEEVGPYSSQLKTDSVRYYGNNIKYIGIRVNTTIRYQTLGYTEGLPIMYKWEEFVNNEMKKMPNGMQNGFQITWFVWHWLIVQELLVKNAIYGIAIGVSVAFPLLTIATRNIITGTLATISMCSSTVCVLGVIPLCGWKLGVLESLNMCMVVGLTVDYVVHLAEGYTLSLRNDRRSRVQDMLDEMAVSVFFGACTTLGASMFMFIAQLSFFFQFGVFMFTTIGFSLLFSMGMFVTLMGIFGPENDTGNIVVMARRVRNCCRGNPTPTTVSNIT